MLDIKIHRSTDLAIAEEFYIMQRTTLRQFGVSVSSLSSGWQGHDHSYMIVGYKNDNMVGGMRLDIDHHTLPMPLSYPLPSLYKDISNYGNVGEICAMWTMGIKGLPMQLLIKSIQLADKQELDAVYAFANQYTKKYVETLGFKTMKGYGKEGLFYYPTKQYPSWVMRRGG